MALNCVTAVETVTSLQHAAVADFSAHMYTKVSLLGNSQVSMLDTQSCLLLAPAVQRQTLATWFALSACVMVDDA
jgi:hypothetical protein